MNSGLLHGSSGAANINRFTMSEQQNNPLETMNPKEQETENNALSSSGDSSSAAPGKAAQSKIGNAWVKFNAFLNYLDEEVPETPPAEDASESKLKKSWTEFNAFLDSLEAAPGTEPATEKTYTESIRDFFRRCGDREQRSAMLKKSGRFCWNLCFLALILVFLFFVTMYGTVKTLEFIQTHRVRFYPAKEVMEYLIAEHESLEKTASGIQATGKNEVVPADTFDAKCIELLKPVKIYSDEYGVYLMTSKSWYAGEHGIFIARDAEKMPPALSWGVIEGRVFTYLLD